MALHAHMVTIDCAQPGKLAGWWLEAFGGEVVNDFGDFVMTKLDAAPVLVGFQRVPEQRAAKNRVHLDFGADDMATEVERLQGLGAAHVADHAVEGFAWTTLQDPEGNEFCVSQEREWSAG
jgi:predicted enzyme related to lactoylglutathione lyase